MKFKEHRSYYKYRYQKDSEKVGRNQWAESMRYNVFGMLWRARFDQWLMRFDKNRIPTGISSFIKDV